MKKKLFLLQLFSAFLGFSVCLWKLADLFKVRFMGDMYSGIRPWITPYYHPYDGALVNYLFLAAGIGALMLAVYTVADKYREPVRRLVDAADERVLFALCAVSAFMLMVIFWKFQKLYTVIPAAFLCILPFAQLLPDKIYKRFSYAIPVLLFLLLTLEPVRLFFGPVRLMNEYQELYGTTLSGPVRLNNREFLKEIPKIAEELRPNLQGEAGLDLLTRIKPSMLSAWANTLSAAGSKLDFPALLSLQHFVKANSLEYAHQVMGRGQANHIGHILNPINEYALGKPLKEISMQYGVGNTLLFKWTMELFGGVSLQNYYKCYVYYVFYYAIFLWMLIYVFRDSAYVICGFCAVALMHFLNSYGGFVLAPGIIPTIHFFDAAMVLVFAAFFRDERKLWPLVLSGAFVACALLLNRQFGGMLAAAWVVAMAVYGFEKGSGPRRFLFIILPLFLTAVVVWATGTDSGGGTGGVISSYFSGFFSWRPRNVLVLGTMVYFAASYLFLLRIKDDRSGAKYLYILSFVYSQGLFVYFYWSGLLNHLQLVLPFIVLQGLFAARLLEAGAAGPWSALWIGRLTPLGIVFSLLLAGVGGFNFYYGSMGKKSFDANFINHKTYEWGFERAKLFSTIDPAAFTDAVSLVHKYSSDKGIAIISKYDNLLPFLSGRYSLMPYFEMSWYIVSDERAREAVTRLHDLKAEYVFVDTDINSTAPDPWGLVYNNALVTTERAARAGRLAELRKLFSGEAGNYKLVESGALLSVYKRLPAKS